MACRRLSINDINITLRPIGPVYPAENVSPANNQISIIQREFPTRVNTDCEPRTEIPFRTGFCLAEMDGRVDEDVGEMICTGPTSLPRKQAPRGASSSSLAGIRNGRPICPGTAQARGSLGVGEAQRPPSGMPSGVIVTPILRHGGVTPARRVVFIRGEDASSASGVMYVNDFL